MFIIACFIAMGAVAFGALPFFLLFWLFKAKPKSYEPSIKDEMVRAQWEWDRLWKRKE